MWLRLLWIIVLALLALSAKAQEGVTVLLSEDGGVYADFAIQLRTALDKAGANRTPIQVVTLNAARSDESTRRSPLLIAVGTPAMAAVAQKPPGPPVLNVLVSRSSFRSLARTHPHTHDTRVFSAVFFDQPWSRQFALIRNTISGRRVGIVLGKESADLIASLQAAAREAQMTLMVESVGSDADLLPALKRLLPNSDALLAVPDATIYNRDNISTILLTSYRAKVPLFGFSSPFVKAGALAAVYSQPGQIAQQVADIIHSLPHHGGLPIPQSPRDFSVSVNAQVRLSLELPMVDEARLTQLLKQVPEGAQ